MDGSRTPICAIRSVRPSPSRSAAAYSPLTARPVLAEVNPELPKPATYQTLDCGIRTCVRPLPTNWPGISDAPVAVTKPVSVEAAYPVDVASVMRHRTFPLP